MTDKTPGYAGPRPRRFVWTRTNEYEFSRPAFVLLITGFMLAGITYAGAWAYVTHDWHPTKWWLIIALIVAVYLSLKGQNIYNKHDEPLWSLVGYAIVAGPFGAVLGPLLAKDSPETLLRSGILVTALVVGLGIIGALVPTDLRPLWPMVTGALLILLAGYFVLPFFGSGALSLWDSVVAIVFCGVVIYDFNSAMHGPRTLDKAVDAGADNFLNFLNIWLRLKH